MTLTDSLHWNLTMFSGHGLVTHNRLLLSTLESPVPSPSIMLKLFQRKESFESEDHARYWLIRVTINQCKNSLRLARLRRHEELDDAALSVQFQQPEHSKVYREVMALPERYRTVLYLFYYEELSVNKIALLLGIKSTAVTTRLSRARQKLKTKLTEVWKDEE